MASSTYHTIAVQGPGSRKEGLADVAITPGELLRYKSDGDLEPHGTAGGVLASKLVALESQTPDSESAASIDVDYAIGETVHYAVGRPGEVYYMWLKAGETAVKGITQLVSDGAGALQAETVDASTLANSVVGVPAESYDNSGGGSRVRLLVEIV